MIQVIKPGEHVAMSGNVDAVVVQVCIQSQDRISYEVVWWAGNTRNTAWVSDFEVVPKKGCDRIKIGFK